MFFRVLAVVLTVSYAVTADLCCFPNRFQLGSGGNGVSKSNGNQLLSLACNSSVDFDLGRTSTDCILFSPAPDVYRIIQDYKNGKSYFILPGPKACNVSPLKTKAMQCIPEGQEISDIYFGNKEGNSLEVKSYAVELNGMTAYLGFSAKLLDNKECNMMSKTIVYQGDVLLQSIGYFNYTTGIADPSVFDVPPSCNEVNQHQSPTERFLDAMKFMPLL